jgi:hypothetical protein
MGSKNYVCVACGQDFTRKYSAYRHNRHLHQEGGKILRTLEYIIARTTGEYSSADPVLFMRKRREQTSTYSRTSFPFANIAHNSEDLHQYETTQRKGYESNRETYSEPARKNEAQPSGNSKSSKREQIKSLYKKLFPDAGDILLKRVESGIEQMENESVLDAWLQSLNTINTLFSGFEKPVEEEVSLRLHPDLRDLPHEARSKLAEIEQIMYRLKTYHENTIFEEIKRLGNEYRGRRNLHTLDTALDYWGKKSRVTSPFQ